MRIWILFAAAPLALAACGKNRESPDGRPAAPAQERVVSGLDMGALDASAQPGDNFFVHANGNWLKDAVIPDDYASYGAYSLSVERRNAQILSLLEQGAAAPQGSISRKAGDFFTTYLDVAAIDALGLVPLTDDIAFIRSLNSSAGLMGAFGRKDLAAAAPFRLAIDVDTRNPGAYAVYIEQSGLGLPDRGYYVDEKFAAARARYKSYAAEILSLAGESAAAAKAEAIIALETRIAEAHWESAKRRNQDLAYNPHTRASLAAFAPLDWNAFFAAAGLPEQATFVLREDEAIARLARLVASEPVDAWRDYLIFHLLHANADILPQPFDAARAAFFSEALNAPRRRQDRRRRAAAAVDQTLGEALGELYAAEYFPAETAAAATALVASLRAALRQALDASSWMTDAAKAAAQEKLTQLNAKIGAPQARQDFSALGVVKGDAYGNMKRARMFGWNDATRRLSGAFDRDVWTTTPQAASVFYDPQRNEIVVPAAMLHPPYFDPRADAAANFGAIGAIIAHELTHAFDSYGRKTDGEGVRGDWWTGADAAGFQKRAEALAAQFSALEAAPGLALSGELVAGEAVGDLGGLALAHRAYRLSLKGAEASTVDSLSGDQRFFLAWAQIWRRKVREEQLRVEVLTGPLAPADVRVNVAVRNLSAWYSAFQVDEGHLLYLPPAERVEIW